MKIDESAYCAVCAVHWGPSKMTYVYNGIRVKWSRKKWYTRSICTLLYINFDGLYITWTVRIDHYARSSLYRRSFCTVIKLYVGHFLWPLLYYMQVWPRRVLQLPGQGGQRAHDPSTSQIPPGINLPIFLSTYLSIFLTIYLFLKIPPGINLPIFLSTYLSILLTNYLFLKIPPGIRPSSPSIYLHIYLSF